MSAVKRMYDNESGKSRAKKMRKAFEKDEKNILLQRAVMGSKATEIFMNRQIARIDNNEHIQNEVTPKLNIVDQKQTGRCWLFADLHVASLLTARKFDIDNKFYLSPAYLFFWHKYESIVNSLKIFTNNRHLDIDSSTLSRVTDEPVQEGGYPADTKNIAERYGVVPKYAYEDTFHSKNSSSMNTILESLVRYHMYKIKHAEDKETAYKLENNAIMHVYNTLCIFLGTPPSRFIFEYKEHGKPIRKRLSPWEFYSDYVPFKYADQIDFVSDPRQEIQKKLRIPSKYCNTYGKNCDMINQNTKTLLNYVKRCIDDNISVPFTTDVDKCTNITKGLMDVKLYDYHFLGIGTIPRKERISYNHSHGNHRMVFVGYDDNKGVLKVANSWGKNYGKDGYLYMTERWFHEYVYYITIPRSKVYRADLAVLDTEVEHVYTHDDLF